ncbi:MAG TPA: hypothetical protein VNF48_06975 [Gammaproteobacteria bacterium]|nr:hypothetical protein [Gammaproteobacteria bacterium]
MRWVMALLLMLTLGACSEWVAHQHANELSQMRQDDEACVNKGVHYPEADYVNCRYNLQNERLYYNWKCMQMAKCASTQPSTGPSPFNQTETYKPLDVEHFQCWKEPQFGGDYVYCGEKDGS